jgi:glycosyltransferase involved in cell wall biosynthesis
VRAAARALYAGGVLHSFHTTISASSPMAEWLPARPRRQLLRRRFADIPASLIRTHPVRESVRLMGSAFNLPSLTRPGAWACVDAVYEAFDRQVARHLTRLPVDTAASSVYGYEDGADQTFRAAHARDLSCVYELPIAYWETTQRLLHEEAERLPAWRPTLHGLEDSREKLDRKVREIESADVVVVPSQFVLETLPERIRRTKTCVLAPFGSPPPRRMTAPADDAARLRPLRVLFAGAMTQRKGLGDLFAAMHRLNRSDVQLVVMGSLLAPMAFYRDHYPHFIHEPPRSHSQVLALMQTCDVLALPAIVEGRALVQHEALASGLPLVVTANGGGEDLVDEGHTGFLVPIRSPDAIAERLAWFADHRDRLPDMCQSALKKAADTGWARYEWLVKDAAMQALAPVAPASLEIG